MRKHNSGVSIPAMRYFVAVGLQLLVDYGWPSRTLAAPLGAVPTTDRERSDIPAYYTLGPATAVPRNYTTAEAAQRAIDRFNIPGAQPVLMRLRGGSS